MSIKEMIDKLSRLRDEYRSLDEEQRESPYGVELLSEMEQLNEELKQIEANIEMEYKNRLYGIKRQRFIDKVRRWLGRLP